MEVVQRWVLRDVVRVEVVVVVVVVRVRQPLLRQWLWSSSGGRGWSWRLDLAAWLGRRHASWGGVAAAGRELDSVQDLWLGDTVPDGLVRRVRVLLVGGPGLAAGDGL